MNGLKVALKCLVTDGKWKEYKWLGDRRIYRYKNIFTDWNDKFFL